MALHKDIRQEDGVTTSYHRILHIIQTVNRQTSISVLSYVDETARNDEKTLVIQQPYSKSITYETTYDENMTVAMAYDFLKTLPQFEGAEDV